MLTLVVVFCDEMCQTIGGRSQRDGAVGQTSDVLQQVAMFDGGGRSLAPGKGRVSGNEDAGNRDRVKILFAKKPCDYRSCVMNVCFFDLFSRERLGNRNRTMKIIGMSCAEAGNRPAGLRPGRRKL